MINNLTTSRTARQQIDFRLAATVSNILVIINSSSNFVLYSSLSTKFRRTFRQLFCTRCYRTSAAATAAKCANGQVPPAQRVPTGGKPAQNHTGTRNEYQLVSSRLTQL